MSDRKNSIVEKGFAGSVFQNAGMLLCGTISRMVITFLFIYVAADRLGVDGFGIYTIGFHFFEMSLGLSATGIAMLLTREVTRWPKRENELISSALAFGLLVALIWGSILMTVTLLFGYSGRVLAILPLAFIALIPASLCTICEGVLIARQRADSIAIGVGLESSLRAISSLIAIFAGFGLETLFLILITTRTCQLVAIGIFIARSGSFKFRLKSFGLIRFFHRWKIYAAETWMAEIYMGLDVIFLSIFAGETAVGLYGAAWKIVRLGSVVARAYATAVFPVLCKLYQTSKGELARLKIDSIRLMIAGVVPAVVTVSLCSNLIIGLVYKPEYAGSIPVLSVLALIALQEFLNPFLSFTLYAMGRQKRTMQVAAIALAVNLVATSLLVYWFSAVGAAIGTAIAGFVAMTCYLYWTSEHSELALITNLFGRALIASFAMVAVASLFAAQLVGCIVGFIVYLGIVFGLGVIASSDFGRFWSMINAKRGNQA